MAKRKYCEIILQCLCVSLLVGSTLSNDETMCKQVSPCLCQFENFQTIDLSHLLPDSKFLEATKGNYTFFYHGCVDEKFSVVFENISADHCTNQELTLCLFDATSRNLSSFGKSTNGKFQTNQNNPNLHDLIFTDKDVGAIITLICTPESQETELVVHSASKSGYVLHIYSPKVCKIYEYTGLSTGSKLFIMFMVFTSIYFIGGACLRYFLRGARGIEIIPNISFWMSLPGLVKDGVLFVMGGCSHRVISSAETYDQI